MSANYIEDALIANIDHARAGRRPEDLDEERQLEVGRLNFFAWAVNESIKQAERFPGVTDAQLAVLGTALSMKLGMALVNLKRFARQAGMSRRRMRRLDDREEESDLRMILKGLEQKVADLEREYTEAVESLHARRFLKEQPKLTRIGLRLERDSDLEYGMTKLRERYPDGTCAAMS